MEKHIYKIVDKPLCKTLGIKTVSEGTSKGETLVINSDKVLSYLKSKGINTDVPNIVKGLVSLNIIEVDRATGRTTRIIDKCIQDFFTNGSATLIDHEFNGSNRHLYESFIARLEREHFFKKFYTITQNLDRAYVSVHIPCKGGNNDYYKVMTYEYYCQKYDIKSSSNLGL